MITNTCSGRPTAPTALSRCPMTISTVSSRSWTVGCSPWTGRRGPETFIGQYSNFSYAPGGTSAFGSGSCIELTLSYCRRERGTRPRALVPRCTVISRLYVNGVVCCGPAERGAGRHRGGPDTRLRLEVRNDEHYYSGLVYPAVLGTAADGERLVRERAVRCVLVLGRWPRRCSRSRCAASATAMRLRATSACCAPPSPWRARMAWSGIWAQQEPGGMP